MFRKVSKTKSLVVCGVCVCVLLNLLGCRTSTGTGTLVGAGLGQLIGGDTKGTLIGAGIGAGVGYLIDSAKDKKAAQSYDYSSPTPLTGTKWKVVSLVKENKPQYQWITVEFRQDGIIETIRAEPGGTKTTTEEKYRIVGNTLIIHKTDYIVNATYSLYGNELIVTTEKLRAVLQKV